MKPRELAEFTVPQFMCLMASTPLDIEESRITTAAQYLAMVEKEKQAEREWSGKS